MLRLLLARAVRRGLWEGSRPWMVIGVLAWLVRQTQKEDPPEVVYSQRIDRGHSLTITVREPR